MKRLWLLALIGFLPACMKQKSNDQSRQLDARQTYDNAHYEYERELSLFREMSKQDPFQRKETEKKLKDEVLLKNETYNDEHKNQWFGKRWLNGNSHENYPFIQYKKHLDGYIKRLDQARNSLYWKNEGVGYMIAQLVGDLEHIRKYIVTSPSYQREHRMIEEQKLQAAKAHREKLDTAKAKKSKKS